MKIIETLKKNVGANEVIELDLCKNRQGDVVCSALYLELPANDAVAIQGKVDTTYQTLKAIDMANYAVVNSITNAGYYMIPATALQACKFTFTSACDNVVIKEVI